MVLLIWTLLPIYHMCMMAVSPNAAVSKGHVWPDNPTLTNFLTVINEGEYHVSHFWRQLFNSVFVAFMTTLGVLAVGTMSSFAIARLRPRWANALSNVALATYVIPLSFLAIPMFKVMAVYHLLNTEWSLIIALIAFASPYAMWVFTQYARSSIPAELDEAARIDGADAWRLFARIFVPLMRPVLVAIGTYAMLLAWNEYLLAFLFLSSSQTMTLPVALSGFVSGDLVPWNLLMATSLFYAVPPVVVYYLFRRHVTSGLTAGGVKA
ncbi:MAG: carbohydrate ABC transporter permease [Streptosporangiaceae bacterium]